MFLGLYPTNVWQVCQQCSLRAEKILRKYVFFWKIRICKYFWILTEKFSGFGKTIRAGLSKLHSTRPQERFEESFEKFMVLLLSSVFERKIFGRVIKTAFYVSRRTFWRKTIFSKKILFFFPIRALSEQFLAFSKKLSAGLLKLHSMCPEEHFEIVRKFFPNVNANGKHRLNKRARNYQTSC